jgi:uncharacterized protein YbbC (DUF1343 family)
MKKSIFGIASLLIFLMVNAQSNTKKTSDSIRPAAYRTEAYLPLLKNKRVGVFANHTATIGKTHLVDSLQKMGVNIVIAFAPEHGFRGKADAGEDINNYKDSATGIKVVSLYGKKSHPSAEDLKGVDILLFDIQDVGLRYYTYISSLQEFIETAFENNKPLIILDRPNPNGFYVDGPVLDTAYKSFVGMQPIPIVYGMTIGEYATMISGEKWLTTKANEKYASFDLKEKQSNLIIVPCENYTHLSKYILPIKPSPNLPDMSSIYWYGSTCFFEGTNLSEGRGTDHPFAIFGSPLLPNTLYSFTPTSREGAKDPKLKDQLCFGWNLSGSPESVLKQVNHKIQIQLIIKAYQQFPNKEAFFLKPSTNKPTAYYFNKLAGNKELMEQIIAGKSEEFIRKSWEPKINAFKTIRKKYLLYPDFE